MPFPNFANFKQFLVAPSTVKGGSISFAGCIQLLGFCAFEACVGLFWPSIMKMRSQYIPEEARSTIMNFFRIPLNIFVCVVLYNVCYSSWSFIGVYLRNMTLSCKCAQSTSSVTNQLVSFVFAG